jgi:SAM-dependent methyltransferase
VVLRLELEQLGGRGTMILTCGATPGIPGLMDVSEIAAEVDRLGPWITGFTAGGRDFGGQYFAEYDTRVRAFLNWLGPRRNDIRRLLECGCLEGGHTAALAAALPDAQIFATEIRAENLARAALLARVRNLANAHFRLDDLEEPAASLTEAYDAVVCIGLLYHLRHPEKFLARCARSAPILWLWTIYCSESEATFIENGYRGRIYTEPTAHPLSGVRAESFFPSLGSLLEMALAGGYQRIEIIEREITKNGNGPAVLLCATRP